MKLLFIKLGALGDVVRSSYFLPGLRKKLGASAQITWITSERAVPLLKNHPEINLLLTAEGIANKTTPWGKQHFDWVISLDDEAGACKLLDGQTWTKLTGAFVRDGSVDYSADAAPWFDMGLISHLGKTKADELKKINQKSHDEIFAGILEIEVAGTQFYNSPAASGEACELLNGKSDYYIGLNLTAGDRWQSKQLERPQAEILINNLTKAGYPLMLLGGPEDIKQTQWLAEKTGCPLLPPVRLEVFAAVVGHLKALITADTMALHLAIAQRIPSVSFFAPTSAAEINTFGTGIKIKSLSPDYCNYKSNADNSSITASRLLEAFADLMRK
jgi:heptosyltransferase II